MIFTILYIGLVCLCWIPFARWAAINMMDLNESDMDDPFALGLAAAVGFIGAVLWPAILVIALVTSHISLLPSRKEEEEL